MSKLVLKSNIDDENDVSISGRDDLASAPDEKKGLDIASKETTYVLYTRVVVLLVLVSVATVVSVAVFISSRNSEHESFDNHAEAVAHKLATEFVEGANRRISAVKSFSAEITSYAEATNSSWPNILLPDFERRGKFVRELSNVASITFFPFVTNQTRESWEEFSVENQGWIAEGLAIQGIPEEDWDKESISVVESLFGNTTNLTIPTKIFKIQGSGHAPEDGEGPYAPWWQFTPVVPVVSGVNYNGFSNPTRSRVLTSLVENHRALVTQAWDYSDETNIDTVGRKAALNLFLQHGGSGNVTYEYGPASDLYVPIFDTLEANASVVGALSAYMYWSIYFDNVLQKEDFQSVVVLESSCGQMFTFEVDGPHCTYVGPGDLHDTQYDDMEVSTEFGSFIDYQGEGDTISDGQCLYNIRVYPTKETEKRFLTNEPMQFTLILASVFVFTCSVFLLYDFMVQRRQFLVMASAQKSGAVVASLFPEHVRNRLYDEQTSRAKGGKDDKSRFLQSEVPTAQSSTELEHAFMAIADMYPDCTVCFMDLVGFTQWASHREPWQVFKLLETLYKTFDRTAKRLDVFKVETVGDCYVAATGLPLAQDNHAILMSRFATECCLKVGRVTHHLADQLGQDTNDLKLRVGMHSGPVTAGVLRGDKARFQLFGDTVNTAARMESTGKSTKVQLSSTTANLLMAAGMNDWVKPREEGVDAKGKGWLYTYWLQLSVVEDFGSVSLQTGEQNCSTQSSSFSKDETCVLESAIKLEG